jgi:hypothetical protein
VALNNAKNICAEDRRHQAIQLKMGGATIEEIAKQTGVSRTQAHNDIKKRLGEVRRDDNEAVSGEYALQKVRYERLLRRWWPDIGSDDPTVALRATEVSLKILRQMDIIGGIIPDKPLIQIQTNLQMNQVMSFAELAKEFGSDMILTEGMEGSYDDNQP